MRNRLNPQDGRPIHSPFIPMPHMCVSRPACHGGPQRPQTKARTHAARTDKGGAPQGVATHNIARDRFGRALSEWQNFLSAERHPPLPGTARHREDRPQIELSFADCQSAGDITRTGAGIH